METVENKDLPSQDADRSGVVALHLHHLTGLLHLTSKSPSLSRLPDSTIGTCSYLVMVG